MYIGNASSSCSSWRLADVPQMSVTDPAVELTICATDRELRYVVTSGSRALRGGGRELLVSCRDTDRRGSTGTSDDSQMCMHCQPAVTRRLAQLDTIRPAYACIDWLCWPIVVNTSFSGMFENRLFISTETGGRKDNECYIHTWRTDDTIIQHKVIRAVNLV